MASNLKKAFSGHRAVVTGASSGIGQEYARQLAEMGADLVIVARRGDRLVQLAKEITSNHKVKVETIELDLNSTQAAKTLFEKATQTGEVTILINNAGIGRFGSFLDFPWADHMSTLQLNSVIPTELTYLFVNHMLAHGRKSYITQVASIAAFQPVSNFSVYSGSKGYLRYFAETLSYELKKTNIHVNCICPGGTYTEFFEHSGQKIKSSGHMAMMSSQQVVKSSIKATLEKKKVFVPGIMNKLACLMSRLVPTDLRLSLADKTMSMAVEKTTPSLVTQTQIGNSSSRPTEGA